jgi:hypothetical protein
VVSKKKKKKKKKRKKDNYLTVLAVKDVPLLLEGKNRVSSKERTHHVEHPKGLPQQPLSITVSTKLVVWKILAVSTVGFWMGKVVSDFTFCNGVASTTTMNSSKGSKNMAGSSQRSLETLENQTTASVIPPTRLSSK